MDSRELRCENGILFGIVRADGLVEVKCRSRYCGSVPGVVVLHRFDVHTGVVTTRRYKDPAYDNNKEDQ